MYDKELVIIVLKQILDSLRIIEKRFEPVDSISDFTDSFHGMEKMDSICMQFIAIGESIKKIDRMTDNKLFSEYPAVNWKGLKGFRDILSHQYFDIDAEEIFWICSNELTNFICTIETIIQDLNKENN